MSENNETKKLVIKSKVKLRFAKEIIYACIVSVVCFSIYEIGELLEKKNALELKQNKDKIDSLPQHQLLWYKLRKNKLYNKDYSKFKLEFKNTEDQILLYRLVSNSGLFTRDFDDFRLKYFKKDAALDDCIALYYKEDRLTENNILNQSESFWKEHKKKVDEFKIQLQNKKVFDEMYQIFVGCGYGRSKEDFKRLIFEPNKEGLDKQKFEYLEMKINKADPQYQAKARNIIIAILLLIYPLRYLGILLKWSLKQIQKNRFEN